MKRGREAHTEWPIKNPNATRHSHPMNPNLTSTVIMERPDRVQEIIDTIIERQTADADTLRTVLTDSSPAIAKGNL